jgi:hypothetical protein
MHYQFSDRTGNYISFELFQGAVGSRFALPKKSISIVMLQELQVFDWSGVNFGAIMDVVLDLGSTTLS